MQRQNLDGSTKRLWYLDTWSDCNFCPTQISPQSFERSLMIFRDFALISVQGTCGNRQLDLESGCLGSSRGPCHPHPCIPVENYRIQLSLWNSIGKRFWGSNFPYPLGVEIRFWWNVVTLTFNALNSTFEVDATVHSGFSSGTWVSWKRFGKNTIACTDSQILNPAVTGVTASWTSLSLRVQTQCVKHLPLMDRSFPRWFPRRSIDPIATILEAALPVRKKGAWRYIHNQRLFGRLSGSLEKS